jgi:hypothetical protein
MKYLTENDLTIKKQLHKELAKTNNLELLEIYLNDQLNEAKVNREDCLAGIEYCIYNLDAHLITWNFVKKNWDILYKKYT